MPKREKNPFCFRCGTKHNSQKKLFNYCHCSNHIMKRNINKFNNDIDDMIISQMTE